MLKTGNISDAYFSFDDFEKGMPVMKKHGYDGFDYQGFGSIANSPLYKMSDWSARKTMQSASRLSPQFLEKTAALIVETDRRMKTSADDPKRLLEVLLLEISREARND